MNILKKVLPLFATGMMTITLCGCVDEVEPTNYVTPEQLSGMTSSQSSLLGGIVAFTVDYNTTNGTGVYQYYLNDWGYPCQMHFRDILTADIPLDKSVQYTNYWTYAEQSLSLISESYYTYYYYYHFINNCNNLIGMIDPATASTTSLNYLGCALTFRALCYFDLARLFEFKSTGYTSLDAKAADVKGLTVSIVKENTTETEMRNNPRVPFYTMYRFIYNDLKNAETYIAGYNRPNKNYPNLSVVYGMMARFWLELGSRFDSSSADLTAQLEHENDEDGYAKLGISSANDCFANASKYARLAEEGYSITTKSQWTNSSTGFNTATDSWMWDCSVSTQEQESSTWSSFLGTMCTEATWAMGLTRSGYREIGSWLYNQISDNDWRKLSYLSPDDAGKTPNDDNALASKYNLASWTITENSSTKTNTSVFNSYPEYANFKFRTRDNTDYIEGLKCDIPMMRVEEMYFIDAEATAHTSGVAAGAAILQNFINGNRYSSGSYTCSASTMDEFNKEIVLQKRIEFWGEGLALFDMKRLKQAVLRSQNTNYADSYLQDSKEGYVCPTMNYFITEYAKTQNTGLILNPDCTGWQNLE